MAAKISELSAASLPGTILWNPCDEDLADGGGAIAVRIAKHKIVTG